MAGKSIQIGNGVYVPMDSIDYYCVPGSAPLKRKVELAREQNNMTDLTYGKKTRSYIFLKTGVVIKSTVLPETITARFNRESE